MIYRLLVALLLSFSASAWAQDMRSWVVVTQAAADGVKHETTFAHPVAGTMYIRGIQSHRYIGNLNPGLTDLGTGPLPSAFWVCLQRAVNGFNDEVFDLHFYNTPGFPNSSPPIMFNPPIVLQPGDVFEIGVFGSGGGVLGGAKLIWYTTTP